MRCFALQVSILARTCIPVWCCAAKLAQLAVGMYFLLLWHVCQTVSFWHILHSTCCFCEAVDLQGWQLHLQVRLDLGRTGRSKDLLTLAARCLPVPLDSHYPTLSS